MSARSAHQETPATSTSGQRPRADARRNREKLVAAAAAAFSTADATVPLEGVARDAGVGIGTLYRHFPTREALVEAVYAAELDDVTASAPALLEQHPPDVALRAWMERYGEFVARKQGLLDTLRTGWASGRIATPATRERLTAAIETLLNSGAQQGTLRGDVDPDDVTAMLLGVYLSTGANGTPEQASRLLDFIVDGLRTPDTT